jgi:hypothetical protein
VDWAKKGLKTMAGLFFSAFTTPSRRTTFFFTVFHFQFQGPFFLREAITSDFTCFHNFLQLHFKDRHDADVGEEEQLVSVTVE